MPTVFTAPDTPAADMMYKSTSVGTLKPVSSTVQGQSERLQRGRTVFRPLASSPLPTLPQFKATRVTSVNTNTKANLFYDSTAKQVYYPIRIPLPSTVVPVAFDPTILAEYDTVLGAPVSVGASATTWLTQAVTMPSGGGPFRAFVSYGAIFDVSASGIMTLWIEDGTNQFVTTQWLVNSAGGVGPGGAGAAYSPVTYANGASITFTAKGWSNAAGSTNIITTPQGGSTQPSWMNIAIFASN